MTDRFNSIERPATRNNAIIGNEVVNLHNLWRDQYWPPRSYKLVWLQQNDRRFHTNSPKIFRDMLAGHVVSVRFIIKWPSRSRLDTMYLFSVKIPQKQHVSAWLIGLCICLTNHGLPSHCKKCV